MYLIKRLWVDKMENHNAYGYESFGFVQTKEEADQICCLNSIRKSDYGYPLSLAHEFPGDFVPQFVAEELKPLSLEIAQRMIGKL